VLAQRRLPAIEIDVAPPPAVEALPRMDVAVFVGFAETGPLHVPVVLESVGEFAGVFGGDAPLAWDDARDERVYAYLAPAVRSFFSAGGRRCWVIRVARVEAARANTFEVPGVLEVTSALDPVQEARAQARSEGSWSDGLRVATALSRVSFGLDALAPASSPGSDRFTFRTRAVLRPGDLLELGDPRSVVAYGVVEEVVTSSDAGGPSTVTLRTCAAFERRADASQAAVDASLERGRWVRQTAAGEILWTRIDEIERRPASTTASGATWRELGAVLPVSLAGLRRGRVATLDVRVTGRQTTPLAGVGLTPSHPSAWWNQQSDAEFYRAPDDEGPRRAAARLASEVARFPLCPANETAPTAWVPLGVEGLFGPDVASLPQPGTPLERDGLAVFDAGLFLDPELATTPMGTLLEFADGIRYRRTPARRLRGIHAALSIGGGGPFTEASLIAIPDAVHLGWRPRDNDRYIPARPGAPVPPDHWRTHRGQCVSAETAPLDEPDFGVFLDCRTRALEAPFLDGPDVPVRPGTYRLSWTSTEPDAIHELVESTQPDFADAREIYRGSGREHVALTQREGVYYYRVFAHAGDERSAGSNAVAVRVRADDYRQDRPDEVARTFEQEWLAVHRAALRLAAASGELFAAFAMPRHFRTPEALRYVQRLRDMLGSFETRALSYGALYFPWLQSEVRTSPERGGALEVVRVRPRQPRVVPPDGPAVGVLAARASSRGAWIAPANEPLNDVVALSPQIPADDWQALQDAQINVVRADPRGFLSLSADTLSRDLALRPINVRRLLTLLRRLALRRGTSYVFEPNGPALRRSVQRGFELLLTDLFRRGAFAGATAAQSFRVVTDEGINTPRDAEAGRFFVELRVAPSIPMRFITVRLAQSGPRLAVIEEL
jgi:hypothetical protein